MADEKTPETSEVNIVPDGLTSPEPQAASEENSPGSSGQPPATGPETGASVQQQYTDDEFYALPDLTVADASRLTPAQALLYKKGKDLEAGYQRKYQAIADYQREVETQRINQGTPQPTAQTTEEQIEKQLVSDYLQDPVGTRANLANLVSHYQTEIASGKATGQDVSESVNALNYLNRQIAKLEVHDRRAMATVINRQQQNEYERAYNQELLRTMPDFYEVAPELDRIAIQELGFSPEDIGRIVHPSNGALSIKARQFVYNIYKQRQGAAAMVGKKEPTRVEGAGRGFDPSPQGQQWSQDDYFALRRKESAF